MKTNQDNKRRVIIDNIVYNLTIQEMKDKGYNDAQIKEFIEIAIESDRIDAIQISMKEYDSFINN